MKPQEIREKTTDELKAADRDERPPAGQLEQSMARDLWKARFSNHSNQLDDTDKIRRLRRDIARVKTQLVERSNEKK